MGGIYYKWRLRDIMSCLFCKPDISQRIKGALKQNVSHIYQYIHSPQTQNCLPFFLIQFPSLFSVRK